MRSLHARAIYLHAITRCARIIIRVHKSTKHAFVHTFLPGLLQALDILCHLSAACKDPGTCMMGMHSLYRILVS